MKHVVRSLAFLVLASGSGLADSPEEPAASLQPFVDRGELAGATTLVATREGVTSLQAVGMADREAGKPMHTDSVFWIASMSKPITATALMMLVDEGKVQLDDPVEKYLPEFHGQTLTAGVVDGHAAVKKPAHPDHRPARSSRTPADSRSRPTKEAHPRPAHAGRSEPQVRRGHPRKRAGDAIRYSNAGINTAGRIIEVVSGQAYEDFLDARLFAPLGMTDTTFWPNSDQLARLATSYKPGAGNRKSSSR